MNILGNGKTCERIDEMRSVFGQETQYIDLGDKRLNRRMETILDQISQTPNSSIPESCKTMASTKAAYRFFDSERVNVADIQAVNFQATSDRINAYPFVLVVQDTSELDFTSHRAIRGMGYLDNPYCYGMKIHTSFAVSPEGIPLGIIDQADWIRDSKDYGKRHKRKQKQTSEKESQRWLTGVQNTEKRIGKSVAILTIADREADIYDLFALPRQANHHLLIRGAHNRAMRGECKLLFEKVLETPIGARIEITIGRNRERKGRQAQVEIRWVRVEIQPPRYRSQEHLPAIPLSAILIEEHEPPQGATPVRWFLLTTREITIAEDAQQCVRWYTMRWLIERYHYTLKSGCQIEELQLEDAERIRRALAIYCIVAWRLLYLTYLARYHPDQPSTDVLDKEELEALSCFVRKSKQVPKRLPTLNETIRMIAGLGGFLGRKGDGSPGVKVLWRGFRHLNDITMTYLLMKDVGNG